ncbi:hypothetical protein J6590_061638 [Homalodisca vitripennis]|nr:hypothetical protein J6590_061638 [Homalodisca vitripennis]
MHDNVRPHSAAAVCDRNPPPDNLVELERAVKEEWERMSIEVIQHLIEGIPRRAQAVIQARGETPVTNQKPNHPLAVSRHRLYTGRRQSSATRKCDQESRPMSRLRHRLIRCFLTVQDRFYPCPVLSSRLSCGSLTQHTCLVL